MAYHISSSYLQFLFHNLCSTIFLSQTFSQISEFLFHYLSSTIFNFNANCLMHCCPLACLFNHMLQAFSPYVCFSLTHFFRPCIHGGKMVKNVPVHLCNLSFSIFHSQSVLQSPFLNLFQSVIYNIFPSVKDVVGILVRLRACF